LALALQAETLLVQQIGHRVGADRMTLTGQLRGQRPGRLRRPPQRRHRIAPLLGFDQPQQRRHQTRIPLA
jgi:hypothetical protein